MERHVSPTYVAIAQPSHLGWVGTLSNVGWPGCNENTEMASQMVLHEFMTNNVSEFPVQHLQEEPGGSTFKQREALRVYDELPSQSPSSMLSHESY